MEYCLQLVSLVASLYLCKPILSSSIDSLVPLERKDAIRSRACSNNDTLIFAHVLYRHGDTNIEKLYPNDPFKDEKYWNEGYGQLTNEGKRQHFKLGQYFRRRYNKLIDNKYTPSKVYIQSTDVDRTLMSAQCNLAGLFDPSQDEIWDKNIRWQPIPVHTIPTHLDYVLYVGKDCPKFNTAVQEHLKNNKEVQRIYTEYAGLFTYWSKMCGSKIKSIDDVYKLHKTLEIEHNRNLPLEDWALEAIERNGTMEYIAQFYHKIYADTPSLARIESGFLLREILERFSQKINSTLQPDRTLWFYSAHSITISFMLESLGLFKLHLPPYACSIHFELYRNSANNYYLQIFYRKSNEECPVALHIPECGQKCSFYQFQSLYKHILPNDFDIECEL